MDARTHLSLQEQFAAAQDWWRDAGVDCLYEDAPVDWLAVEDAKPTAPQTDRPATPAKAAPPPAPTVDTSGWPADLASFAPWWLSEPSLDEGGTLPRVPPRGVAEPDMMVVVPMPEAEDGEGLLSGRHGVLVGNILKALGISPDAAYFASALPRHMAMPDWHGTERLGLGKVLTHHAALVRPRKLLVLGRDIAPLIGTPKLDGAGWSGTIEAGGNRISTMIGYGPETLLQRAQFRRSLWHLLLEWMEATA